MRRIAIVGAGQAGLQLALGLLARATKVYTGGQAHRRGIRQGKIASRCMFNTALQSERDLGLNFWEDACPAGGSIGLCVPNPEQQGSAVQLEYRAWIAYAHIGGQHKRCRRGWRLPGVAGDYPGRRRCRAGTTGRQA
ncbi:hypothetical protein [Pseudomonas peli]|uniref:hypothetical protein n=1 Tax=Pseudomonas peli TaxID=592361 RepID=UPI0024ACEB16|nr:hypothetical protein [Pseudomonas peli]